MRLSVFLLFVSVALSIPMPALRGNNNGGIAQLGRGMVLPSSPWKGKPAQIIGGETLTGMGAARNFEGARKPVPYLVAVEARLPDGSTGMCGGAIVAPNKVLSAAHCVANERTNRLESRSVRVLVTNNKNARPLWSGTGSITMHPRYTRDGGKAADDMIVITLSSPIPLGGDIQAVPLATADPALGVWSKASGYGVTDYAQSRTSPLIKTIDNKVARCSPAQSRVVCTRGIDRSGRRGNTCGGDSGGPLVVGGKLVGVLSRGTADCGQRSPDLADFASVAGNMDFIRQHVTAADMRPQQPQPRPQAVSRPQQSSPQVVQQTTGSQYYRVAPGDTLNRIAARFGVTLQALIDANRGKLFNVGVVLVIPARTSQQRPPVQQQRPPVQQQRPPVQQQRPPVQQPVQQQRPREFYHTVARGDTYYQLARRYFPNESAAQAANRIMAANGATNGSLEPGQRVLIPGL